ncbi:hypothetical protein HDU96_003831 [Phlyctochytrium bullatum]|nr:hypothetical protein HDU96_003831 [Phlyctochytrium bullatum]
MSSPIELVPVEIARRIAIRLHPAWLPNLLATSKVIRRLFAPDDDELQFAKEHLHPHVEALDVDSWRTSTVRAHVPFRKLPHVYAVACVASGWDHIADSRDAKGMRRALACMAVAFEELCVEHDRRLRFRHGPHLSVAWMEKIVLKALQVVRIKNHQEFKLAIKLASLLDSVDVVESALRKLFPDEMNSEGSATGAGEVVMSVEVPVQSESFDPPDVEDQLPPSFAWCMAAVAAESAKNGAVHVLDYALQHPVVPVAFSFSRISRSRYAEVSSSSFLINLASTGGHMHAVHYLLGNPLPLAPPPAARPLRPGNPSDPGLQPSLLRGPRSEKLQLSCKNPVATLSQLGGLYHEPPLQNFLSAIRCEPFCALNYLLDQGAPLNCRGTAYLGPLHYAARREFLYPGIVRFLVQRGADVNDRSQHGRTPLDVSAAEDHWEAAVALLDCGADPNLVGAHGGSETPLMMALEEESFDVARVLLGFGATLLYSGNGRGEHISEELRNRLLNNEDVDIDEIEESLGISF